MTALSRLESFAREAELALDATAIDRLALYRELLLAATLQFNLTHITDTVEFEQRMLIESLALLALVPEDAATLLDVGSGGGVPGLPIAIARPGTRVVLLDATAKKVAFLAEASAALGLDNVTALQGRAEELARDPAHRDRYDVVTARAVARLPVLAELVLPFVALGGIAILPKGADIAEEFVEARYAIRMLRGRERPVNTRLIEGSSVVAIDKRGSTPAQFPRRTGVPSKHPLRGPADRGPADGAISTSESTNSADAPSRNR